MLQELMKGIPLHYFSEMNPQVYTDDAVESEAISWIPAFLYSKVEYRASKDDC